MGTDTQPEFVEREKVERRQIRKPVAPPVETTEPLPESHKPVAVPILPLQLLADATGS